jgi:hypothetical protein
MTSQHTYEYKLSAILYYLYHGDDIKKKRVKYLIVSFNHLHYGLKDIIYYV